MNVNTKIKLALINEARFSQKDNIEKAKLKFDEAWDLYINNMADVSEDMERNVLHIKPKYYPKKKYGSDISLNINTKIDNELTKSYENWTND